MSLGNENLSQFLNIQENSPSDSLAKQKRLDTFIKKIVSKYEEIKPLNNNDDEVVRKTCKKKKQTEDGKHKKSNLGIKNFFRVSKSISEIKNNVLTNRKRNWDSSSDEDIIESIQLSVQRCKKVDNQEILTKCNEGILDLVKVSNDEKNNGGSSVSKYSDNRDNIFKNTLGNSEPCTQNNEISKTIQNNEIQRHTLTENTIPVSKVDRETMFNAFLENLTQVRSNKENNCNKIIKSNVLGKVFKNNQQIFATQGSQTTNLDKQKSFQNVMTEGKNVKSNRRLHKNYVTTSRKIQNMNKFYKFNTILEKRNVVDLKKNTDKRLGNTNEIHISETLKDSSILSAAKFMPFHESIHNQMDFKICQEELYSDEVKLTTNQLSVQKNHDANNQDFQINDFKDILSWLKELKDQKNKADSSSSNNSDDNDGAVNQNMGNKRIEIKSATEHGIGTKNIKQNMTTTEWDTSSDEDKPSAPESIEIKKICINSDSIQGNLLDIFPNSPQNDISQNNLTQCMIIDQLDYLHQNTKWDSSSDENELGQLHQLTIQRSQKAYNQELKTSLIREPLDLLKEPKYHKKEINNDNNCDTLKNTEHHKKFAEWDTSSDEDKPSAQDSIEMKKICTNLDTVKSNLHDIFPNSPQNDMSQNNLTQWMIIDQLGSLHQNTKWESSSDEYELGQLHQLTIQRSRKAYNQELKTTLIREPLDLLKEPKYHKTEVNNDNNCDTLKNTEHQKNLAEWDTSSDEDKPSAQNGIEIKKICNNLDTVQSNLLDIFPNSPQNDMSENNLIQFTIIDQLDSLHQNTKWESSSDEDELGQLHQRTIQSRKAYNQELKTSLIREPVDLLKEPKYHKREVNNDNNCDTLKNTEHQKKLAEWDTSSDEDKPSAQNGIEIKKICNNLDTVQSNLLDIFPNSPQNDMSENNLIQFTIIDQLDSLHQNTKWESSSDEDELGQLHQRTIQRSRKAYNQELKTSLIREPLDLLKEPKYHKREVNNDNNCDTLKNTEHQNKVVEWYTSSGEDKRSAQDSIEIKKICTNLDSIQSKVLDIIPNSPQNDISQKKLTQCIIIDRLENSLHQKRKWESSSDEEEQGQLHQLSIQRCKAYDQGLETVHNRETLDLLKELKYYKNEAGSSILINNDNCDTLKNNDQNKKLTEWGSSSDEYEIQLSNQLSLQKSQNMVNQDLETRSFKEILTLLKESRDQKNKAESGTVNQNKQNMKNTELISATKVGIKSKKLGTQNDISQKNSTECMIIKKIDESLHQKRKWNSSSDEDELGQVHYLYNQKCRKECNQQIETRSDREPLDLLKQPKYHINKVGNPVPINNDNNCDTLKNTEESKKIVDWSSSSDEYEIKQPNQPFLQSQNIDIQDLQIRSLKEILNLLNGTKVQQLGSSSDEDELRRVPQPTIQRCRKTFNQEEETRTARENSDLREEPKYYKNKVGNSAFINNNCDTLKNTAQNMKIVEWDCSSEEDDLQQSNQLPVQISQNLENQELETKSFKEILYLLKEESQYQKNVAGSLSTNCDAIRRNKHNMKIVEIKPSTQDSIRNKNSFSESIEFLQSNPLGNSSNSPQNDNSDTSPQCMIVEENILQESSLQKRNWKNSSEKDKPNQLSIQRCKTIKNQVLETRRVREHLDESTYKNEVGSSVNKNVDNNWDTLKTTDQNMKIIEWDGVSYEDKLRVTNQLSIQRYKSVHKKEHEINSVEDILNLLKESKEKDLENNPQNLTHKNILKSPEEKIITPHFSKETDSARPISKHINDHIENVISASQKNTIEDHDKTTSNFQQNLSNDEFECFMSNVILSQLELKREVKESNSNPELCENPSQVRNSDHPDATVTHLEDNNLNNQTHVKVKNPKINLLEDEFIHNILSSEYDRYRKRKEMESLTAQNDWRGIEKVVPQNQSESDSRGRKCCMKRYRKGKTRIYRLGKIKKPPNRDPKEDNLNVDNVLQTLTQTFIDPQFNLTRTQSCSSVSTASSYITDDNSEILSTGSQDLTKPQQELRVGLNDLLRDKSLFCDEKDRNFSEYDKTKIKMKIQKIFLHVFDDLTNGRRSVLEFRRQTLDNCTFKDKRLQFKEKNVASTLISSNAQNSQVRFKLILYILKKVQTLLETNTRLTKRELYYQLKDMIKNQSAVDRAINAVSCMLDVGMWALNIVAQKGLVFGDLKILLSSGETLNCNIPGTLIPHDIGEILELHSSAYFILVVEKESIFHKLIEEDLPNKLTRPFIMITGKGFPDLNTQLFLRKLWIVMSIPVFILVDADPHGVQIMLNYRFGSVQNAHVSHQLAVPNAKWFGIYPSEINHFDVTTQPLTNNEIKLVHQLLKSPCVVQNPGIVSELNVMLENKSKAGIEGLIKSQIFLSEVYFPTKFYKHKFI